MEFKDFVQTLYSVSGAGNSTYSFTHTIFDAIVTGDGQEILSDYSNNTYKAYFNGNTQITQLAKKINAYIEPEEFCAYVEGFPDAVVQNLCDCFANHIAGIDPHNAGEKLATLFVSIITKAASTKKKGTTKSAAQGDKKSAHDILSEKILASGQAVADAWGDAIERIVESAEEAERVEAEVVDGEVSSCDVGDSEEGKKTTVIQHQTNVVQNGENNFNLTNNGTMNFKF